MAGLSVVGVVVGAGPVAVAGVGVVVVAVVALVPGLLRRHHAHAPRPVLHTQHNPTSQRPSAPQTDCVALCCAVLTGGP
jgi:hypothetical protein